MLRDVCGCPDPISTKDHDAFPEFHLASKVDDPNLFDFDDKPFRARRPISQITVALTPQEAVEAVAALVRWLPIRCFDMAFVGPMEAGMGEEILIARSEDQDGFSIGKAAHDWLLLISQPATIATAMIAAEAGGLRVNDAINIWVSM